MRLLGWFFLSTLIACVFLLAYWAGVYLAGGPV